MKLDRKMCGLILSLAVIIKYKTQKQFPVQKRILQCFFSGFLNKKIKLNWNETLFFQEGFCMRQAAISGLLGKYDPDDYIPAGISTEVKCIGYGFWNGVCRAIGLNKFLKKPGIRINCYHNMIDGQSFAQTLLGDEVKNKKKILTMLSTSHGQIYRCIGAGRALAWLDPDEEVYDISSCPSFESLLAGKVLAYCFTRVHNPSELINKINSLKNIYKEQVEIIEFAYLTALNAVVMVSKNKKDYLINKYSIQEDLSQYSYKSLCNKLLNAGI